MARDDGDYNPVAAQSTIDKTAGILARRKARAARPPIQYGYERVFVDAEGQVRGGRGATTAGERYWASPGMWLNVDTSDHNLAYHFTHRDRDGTAYDIEINVTVRVSNAEEAVRRQVSGVRRYVESSLSTRLDAAMTPSLTYDNPNGVRMLNTRRDEIAQQLTQTITPDADFVVGDWLSVTVSSVSVNFDAATSAHLETLVTTARGAVVDSEEMRRREAWLNHLTPHMADPLKRAVATIAADPTQENIQRVASQLDSDDRWRSTEVIGILNTLIKENYVEDVSQLNAIKAIVETLQRTSVYENREAIDAGSQQKMLPGNVTHEPAGPADEALGRQDYDWSE